MTKFERIVQKIIEKIGELHEINIRFSERNNSNFTPDQNGRYWWKF